MECQIVTVSLLLCVLVSHVPGLFGCSDFEPHMRSPNHKEKDEQKVYYSEYVVFGKAGRTRKGQKFPYSDVDGVRTIEFDVTCFYKATAEVPEKIYVTGVGNRRNQIDGCPPAPLEEGQSAVLYLRKFESDGTMMDNMYDIEFAPMSDKNIDDAQKLDDLTLVCGLNRSFPGEQPLPDSERDLSCAKPIDEEYCTAYTPKTTTKAPPKETVTSGMVTDGTTPKKMEPTPETDAGPSKGGDNIGKPILPDNNATYSTETGGSKGPVDGASMQYLSQTLVLTISVLLILA